MSVNFSRFRNVFFASVLFQPRKSTSEKNRSSGSQSANIETTAVANTGRNGKDSGGNGAVTALGVGLRNSEAAAAAVGGGCWVRCWVRKAGCPRGALYGWGSLKENYTRTLNQQYFPGSQLQGFQLQGGAEWQVQAARRKVQNSRHGVKRDYCTDGVL